MRRRLGIAGVAVAATLLCVAPAATAGTQPSARSLLAGVSRLNDELALLGQGSSGLGLPRTGSVSELRLENRDGYRISVIAFGQTVALGVSHRPSRGHARVSTATYLAHGRVTPNSIAASFGDRGRIAVRFQPSGREVHATSKAGCRVPSDGILAQLGVFAGELSFRGEGDYTSVDVRRVRGRSVNYVALLSCLLGARPRGDAASPAQGSPLGRALPGLTSASPGRSPGVPAVPTHPSDHRTSTTLFANSKAALSRTTFIAQAKDGRPARFFAVDEASEGSIGILRFVFVRAERSAFAFDDTLARARIEPPSPFSGTAELEHGPGTEKSWAGSLAVSFLGAPRVPLTGPPFLARLGRGF